MSKLLCPVCALPVQPHCGYKHCHWGMCERDHGKGVKYVLVDPLRRASAIIKE